MSRKIITAKISDRLEQRVAALEGIVNALVLALPSPADKSGWQPIETAGMDRVLISNGNWIYIGQRNSHGAFGWVTDAGTSTDCAPAYWLPLPKSPLTFDGKLRAAA